MSQTQGNTNARASLQYSPETATWDNQNVIIPDVTSSCLPLNNNLDFSMTLFHLAFIYYLLKMQCLISLFFYINLCRLGFNEKNE